MLFNLVMIIYGISMAGYIYSTGQVSPVLHLPMGLLYMVIPVCFTLMEFRIVQLVVTKLREESQKRILNNGGENK